MAKTIHEITHTLTTPTTLQVRVFYDGTNDPTYRTLEAQATRYAKKILASATPRVYAAAKIDNPDDVEERQHQWNRAGDERESVYVVTYELNHPVAYKPV